MHIRVPLSSRPAIWTAAFPKPTAWRLVGRTVVMLGLTSMLTDISSEMVSTVLPIYFMVYLHLSPFQFGVVDGLYQGSSAVVRLLAGLVADRWRRYKEVAAVGYALSAASRLGLLLVGAAPGPLAGLVLADRTGKGIRTAPRDALISLSSNPRSLGQAFGVHRTLDTLGSMLGPLVAVGLLSATPGAFDVVFVVSLGFAIVGLAALLLLVDNVVPSARPGIQHIAVSSRAAVGLLRLPRFRVLAIAGACLSLFTVSDAFVFLALQHSTPISTGLFPLLYTGTSVVFVALALPAGRLADSMGRERVFLCGYLLLTGCIAVLLLPLPDTPRVALVVTLLGAYYAATDGVLMALASGLLPRELRTTGLGLLTSGTSVGLLLSSLLFGALWSTWGMAPALVLFGLALLAATGLARLGLRLARPVTTQPAARTRWLRHRGCTGCPLAELEHACADRRASAD